MTDQDYKEVAAQSVREQIQAIDAAVHRSMSGLLEQRQGLSAALTAMGFEPPPFKLDLDGVVLDADRTPPRPPEADPPAAPAAPAADTGEQLTQKATADKRRDEIVAVLAEQPMVIGELADLFGVPKNTLGDDIRHLLQDGRIDRTGNRRRAEGIDTGRLSFEYGVVEAPEPLITATTEQVRDCVVQCHKEGSFTDSMIGDELHATLESVNDAFTWMEGRGTIASQGDGNYRYMKPGGGSPARPRHQPPEREPVREQRMPATRGHAVSGTGKRSAAGGVKTSNPAVNALLKEAVSVHKATTQRTGNHIAVIYPNGCRVGVSTTPDASAIGLIRRDLELAAANKGHLIQQGGSGVDRSA